MKKLRVQIEYLPGEQGDKVWDQIFALLDEEANNKASEDNGEEPELRQPRLS